MSSKYQEHWVKLGCLKIPSSIDVNIFASFLPAVFLLTELHLFSLWEYFIPVPVPLEPVWKDFLVGRIYLYRYTLLLIRTFTGFK